MKRLSKFAIGSLAVAFIALAISVSFATVKLAYSASPSALATLATNADVDTTFTPAWCINPAGDYRTNKLLATVIIPNYDSVVGGTGVGLQDTARVRFQYKHKDGSWKWLTATAASDTALGLPPCSLSLQSTAPLLIYADSIRLAVIRFDSAGTAGGGANDTIGSTATFWIDNVSTYLLYQEKQGN